MGDVGLLVDKLVVEMEMKMDRMEIRDGGKTRCHLESNNKL